MQRFRIFVLGAGFSQAAGLPLGPDLWREVHAEAENQAGRGGRFSDDLDLYLIYLKDCQGRTVGRDEIDFEDFLAFLDIEHHLGLSGSDTWSDDGNVTQIIVKQLIGRIISERTPAADKLPDLYYDFARQLEPGDYLLTFNYDCVLEQALDHVGTPYRLFPDRFSEVHDSYSVVNNEGREEVAVLKLHGSIDWFDRSSYAYLEEINRQKGLSPPSRDPVFSPGSPVEVYPLLEGPRPEEDRLRTVFRVTHGLDAVYSSGLNFLGGIPFLLTPSRAKALYIEQFKTFWWGMGQAGGYNLGIVLIGYSLPEHDEYAKQALFRLLRNYQESWWTEEFLDGQRKEKVIFIDRQEEEEGRKRLRARYGFLDESKTEFIWTGLDAAVVELIRRGVVAN